MTNEWEFVTDYQLMDNNIIINSDKTDNKKDNKKDNKNSKKKTNKKCQCLNYLSVIFQNLNICIINTVNDIKKE